MAVKKTEQEVANDKAQKIMDTVNERAGFYRANPHRFAKDYLGLELKMFQQVLIYMMNVCTNFQFCAARGLGKSFLCAVFCVIRCILYPGTKICIACKVRSQSINILDEKIIKEMIPRSPYLRAEIKKYVINQSEAVIEFHNSSYIKVVTASDSARGNRANIVVVDESRMLDKSTIDLVLKRFLTAPRHPGYLDKPEYAHLMERNKEIYLTSAWFQNHWNWQQCKDYFASMFDTSKNYFCCFFPYQMSVREGLLMKEAVEDEMAEASFSELKWAMEMEAKWVGTTDGSIFNIDDIERNRQIEKAFYPPQVVKSMNSNKFKVPEKAKDEVRVLTADIALMSSKKRDNDATSIFLNCLNRTKDDRYISKITYTENIEGIVTQDLALILRRYFEWFNCDYIGIDCRGIGLGVADALMRDIYDPETGETYCAISCCNNPEIAERCNVKTAPKVMWAIMGSAQFNSDVAIQLRDGFRQGRIKMLINEYECESEVRHLVKGYDAMTPTEKIALQLPYINTGLTVNELVNLEYESKNGIVRVHEKSGSRKDRYSSLSYNYFIAQQLERNLKKKSAKPTQLQFNFRAPVKRGGWF